MSKLSPETQAQLLQRKLKSVRIGTVTASSPLPFYLAWVLIRYFDVTAHSILSDSDEDEDKWT
jgi:hypothetical protein